MHSPSKFLKEYTQAQLKALITPETSFKRLYGCAVFQQHPKGFALSCSLLQHVCTGNNYPKSHTEKRLFTLFLKL